MAASMNVANSSKRSSTGASVSLLMIVRDEELTLPTCLNSVDGLFDEIVIVDTGSVDQTRELARSFGATVVDFPWCDSFSAARNAGLARCAGEFVFWLDADEFLTIGGRSRLSRLLQRKLEKNTIYVMPEMSSRPDGGYGFSEALTPRLFPNCRSICWDGRVHEQILQAAFESPLTHSFVPVQIQHTGFSDLNRLYGKLLRNQRLSQIEIDEGTGTIVARFRLALTLSQIGRCCQDAASMQFAQEHLENLQESALAVMDVRFEADVCSLLVDVCRFRGDVTQALRVIEQWKGRHTGEKSLLDAEGDLLIALGLWRDAEALFDSLPRMTDYAYLRDMGISTYMRLLSGMMGAAWYFEETGRPYRAFRIWLHLRRTSLGAVEVAFGLRRSARRLLVQAVNNPRLFWNDVRWPGPGGVRSCTNLSAAMGPQKP